MINPFSNFGSKSTLNKISVILWAITGGLLASIIIMFVALSNTYKETSGKVAYDVVLSDSTKGKTVVDVKAYQVDEIDSEGKVIGQKSLFDALMESGDQFRNKFVMVGDDIYRHGSSTIDSTTKKVVDPDKGELFYTLDKLYLVNAASNDYITEKVDGKDVKIEGPTITEKAKRAQNATAAIGALFTIGITAALATTVAGVAQQKRSGGKK